MASIYVTFYAATKCLTWIIESDIWKYFGLKNNLTLALDYTVIKSHIETARVLVRYTAVIQKAGAVHTGQLLCIANLTPPPLRSATRGMRRVESAYGTLVWQTESTVASTQE